ncbi:MAG: zinc ABC transporter substrate-binding protein, partial [Candidatus Odinarchaeota archaeon]
MLDKKTLGGVITLLIITTAGVSSFLILSNPQINPAGSKISIAVTIPVQAEIAEMIGGGHVKVTVLVPSGADPHSYEPTPSQLTELSAAQIYFFIGSGLEFELTWWDQITSINPNILLVNASEGVTIEDKDPHIWTSPRNVKIMAENLHKALLQLDPSNQVDYDSNLAAYLRALDFLDNYVMESLGNYTNRVFLIFHPAFNYFAKAYNLTQISIEEEGKPVTPQSLQWAVENA